MRWSVGIAVLIVTSGASAEAAWAQRSRPHPCPTAVDSARERRARIVPPHYIDEDAAGRRYVLHILQVQLEDSVSVPGLCRILRASRTRALDAWQPQERINVLVELFDPTTTLEGLEMRRAALARIPGVHRVAFLELPRLIAD